MAGFYSAIPRNAKFLSRQNINVNVDIRSNMLQDVLGHQGLNNHYLKSKYLPLTYFKGSIYTTCRSFNSTRYPFKLDNFICYLFFSRQIKDCKVVNIVMWRRLTAILTTFNITSIKLKVIATIVMQTYWKLIGHYTTTNDIFNNSLSISIYGSTTYSNYNK